MSMIDYTPTDREQEEIESRIILNYILSGFFVAFTVLLVSVIAVIATVFFG